MVMTWNEFEFQIQENYLLRQFLYYKETFNAQFITRTENC